MKIESIEKMKEKEIELIEKIKEMSPAKRQKFFNNLIKKLIIS